MRLKSVGVLSAAKISAILYGGMALLFVPILLMFAVIMPMLPSDQSRPPAVLFAALAVFMPFVYAAMGFVVGAGSAFVYNLAAGWVGGIEMHFESLPSGPVYAPQATAPPMSQT